MRIWQARVREIRLGPAGRGAWIDCPPGAVPAPGQFVVAWSAEEADEPLAEALFLSGRQISGFQAAAPVPANWEPGTRLSLRGPCGHGFCLPSASQRVLMVALDRTAERLLAVLPDVMELGCAVALCADGDLPSLPAEVEIHPLNSLEGLFSWAELLLVDTLRSRLGELAKWPEAGLHVPGQVLVHTSMPCGGLADCGACAVQGSRRPKLACKDGPVFSLAELARFSRGEG